MSDKLSAREKIRGVPDVVFTDFELLIMLKSQLAVEVEVNVFVIAER
jgi:hypothetical protein